MWRDQRNILAKFSVFRTWNLIQLYYSYLLAKYFKRVKTKGLPYAASIEPTTACNLGCPECPSGLKQFTRPTGKLDMKEHLSMLDQLGKQLFYINYYFQGEPFLHPGFLELIKAAHQRKIYTATSTNAHFITKEKAADIVASGLDRMIISIDGLTQETYEQYRKRGKLEKVIEGTKHMIEAKKNAKSNTPHLIFQFLVVRPNEHEIDDVFKLGKSLGVDEVRLKTAQLYDYENGNPLMPKNEKYSRYKRMKDGTYKSKYTLSDHCWRMWSSTVLTWDGKVVPCCFDKDAQHVLGDALKADFKQIWNSPQYQSFRKQVFTDRSVIDICKNCSEGAKVWT
ncbi:radical SAM protein [Brumimicrobium glaciale]|jgi:radical SAM protein with 4Fe4S-binding SPASM domain|uniref:Radical SAM protein n=1 Tax=Brumimicrobium glaciale TaxID=200475 RepID=A0A4Q4KQ98_9FLAO|nr:radical SAM/SPASM domain-containing protein [Brumimicrobium glaciale]RYM35567.1 radical SAM protein [Brumimicrobium glaciale]